jgi:hypothetical protein
VQFKDMVLTPVTPRGDWREGMTKDAAAAVVTL